jgi:hypothetical protein
MENARDYATDKVNMFKAFMGYDDNPYEPVPLTESNAGFGMRGAPAAAGARQSELHELHPDYDDHLLDDADMESQSALAEALSLTRKERLLGFLLCFLIGWILSFSSLSALDNVIADPAQFAVLYTAGNIVSLCSTMFLHGPTAQIRSMFLPARRVATVTYLAAIAATLVAAYALRAPAAVLVCMLVQFCAMLWYSLSFIPYGRFLAGRLLASICPCAGAPEGDAATSYAAAVAMAGGVKPRAGSGDNSEDLHVV